MGKSVTVRSSATSGLQELSRKRRRASQTKHRHQVASCYQRLRLSLPTETWISRNGEKQKVLNKAAVLIRSKNYILHLEKVLSSLLKRKRLVPKCLQEDNMVARTIGKFCTIEDFRRHFGDRFHPDVDVVKYFEEYKEGERIEPRKLKRKLVKQQQTIGEEVGASSQSSTKSRGSSQVSDDPGFYSGEGGSQERSSDHNGGLCGGQTEDRSCGAPAGYKAYGSTMYRHYPMSYGVFPNRPYFDNSQFYFYVPAVGYPAPFYAPFGSNLQPYLRGNFSPVGKYPRVIASPSILSPTLQSCVFQKDSGLKEKRMAGTPSATATKRTKIHVPKPIKATAMPNLKMRYTYSEPDGKMSPPRICLRGLPEKPKSAPTLIVIENGNSDCEDSNNECFACPVPSAE